MDPKWQSFFFALAILLFALYAIGWNPKRASVSANLQALGLAIFVIPFLYSAVVAGW